MDRTILHCDLNGFYASVEALYHPEYRDRPLAVGGLVEDRHGIILAKNEQAKKYQIKTGQTLQEAKDLCPNLVIIPPDYSKYLLFSKRVREIMLDYTNRIEPFGIDETWLDVSDCQKLFGDGKNIADELRKRIREELGITASVGVSYNKIFAKLGSDYKKPDATTLITRENKRLIVDPLPVGDLLYVGKSTQKKLHYLGVDTIGQLAEQSGEVMEKLFGKNGLLIWCFAKGLDNSKVRFWEDEVAAKSIGNTLTGKRDLITWQDVRLVLYLLAQNVAARLREQNFLATKVAVSWRDNELLWFSRQKGLNRASCLTDELWKEGYALIYQNYDLHIPLRSVGIKAFGLVRKEVPQQLSVFVDEEKRSKRLELERTMDRIKSRFGSQSITTGLLKSNPLLSGYNPQKEQIAVPADFH